MRGTIGPALKKGGKVQSDSREDRGSIRQAIAQHEKAPKPRGHGMKAGGMVRGRGDGCVSKGRTRG